MKNIKDLFIVFIAIISCNNLDENGELIRLNDICNLYHLRNCTIEYLKSYDSKDGKGESIIVEFEETSNLDTLFLKNYQFLTSSIAYEIFKSSHQKDHKKKYSKIIIKGVINQESKERNYLVEELNKIENASSITDSFFKFIEDEKVEQYSTLVDNRYIIDSALFSIREGIISQNGGEIKKNILIGFDFDKIKETNEKVIILSKYLERQKKSQIFTFYLLEESNKIIYIDFKSS